jgi:cell division protein FtsZ
MSRRKSRSRNSGNGSWNGNGTGSKNTDAGQGKRGGGDSLDLLEIGPDDEHEILDLEMPGQDGATIKVVGVGGGGGNALNTMIESRLAGVDFIAANTDSQALEHNLAPIKLQLGDQLTRGLGCGASPDRGRSAALEDQDRLREFLADTDMVFVTAGLGGGTGTGAAPVIAEVAREAGALTVAVVTKPFQFEGRVRMRQAEAGLDELHRVVDTLITIPNHRLLALAGKDTSVREAFKLADEVLFNAVRGISDLITVHGLINLDFADVRTIMNEMGRALMGTGAGRGDTRAADAAGSAISSPLLEDLSIEGAHGVLINITGGSDMTLFEVNEASSLIQAAAHEDANIIFGAVIDPDITDGELRVTVIATGLDEDQDRRSRAPRREELSNVTPLRPPAGEQREPVPAAQADAAPSAERVVAKPAADAASQEEFLSPFEDELDVPAFLRKRDKSRVDDREQPAFLRRSAD